MECTSLGHISILLFLSVDLVTVVVPCSSYIANGNVRFRPYPGDCSKFVQCHQGISGVKGAIRQCPFGQFWHHDVISCHRSGNVNCPEDPCLLSPDGFTYGMNGFSCRSFWLCQNGRSIGAFCDEGTYYLESVGCVIGQFCDTPCPPNVGFSLYFNELSPYWDIVLSNGYPHIVHNTSMTQDGWHSHWSISGKKYSPHLTFISNIF